MIYKKVDIFSCKFFAVDSSTGKLKFISGAHKGKTAADFNKSNDIKKIIAYCFWIITDAKFNFPLVTKYCASAFLEEMIPKLKEIEDELRKMAIQNQKELKKITEDLTKTTGTKYI